MKKLALIIGSVFLFVSCHKVPVTGREQFDIVPNNEMLSLSATNYKDFLTQNKLSTNTEQAAMVKRVGQNIANAVEKYFAANNMKKELNGYNWEFNLVENAEVNAWCMPGGKVVVYTGIMPLVQNDAGLGVVLGHEISHAVAKHGNERMSQQLVSQLGGVALQVALRDKPQQTQSIFMSAYGAGSTVGVLLPFSRMQESEADRLGLIFMAMAGYDPRIAVDFWKRMSAQSKSGSTPEFLSTHPSDQTRIQDIEKHLPEALKYYNQPMSTK